MNIKDTEFCICDISINAGVRHEGKTLVRKEDGRDKHGILYLFSGSTVFSDIFGEEILRASEGDLVYIPKGARYKMVYATQTHFALFSFNVVSPDFRDKAVESQIKALIIGNTESELISIFKSVERLFGQEGESSIFKRKELLYKLFSHLSVRNSYSAVDKRIAEGVRLLEERYLENLPITEFAAASYVSVSTFRRLFFEHFALSPNQYRNHLRLRRAKSLLEDGEYTISEVAALSGFCNESYFCRYYKKIFGTTPKGK